MKQFIKHLFCSFFHRKYFRFWWTDSDYFHSCSKCGYSEKLIAIILLCATSSFGATLKWDDINGAGTSFIISNKTGTTWQYIGTTTNKFRDVTPYLMPGTNTFSIMSSNGLLSDPTQTSTNYPSRVFNIIIEASDRPDGGWQVETNMQQLIATVKPAQFYRLRGYIE